MGKPIPMEVGYMWQHPLATYLWPERYGGLRTAEEIAVGRAVVTMADAWRRNDPATVAAILRDRSTDTLHVAALAAFFIAQPLRLDPNPPSIAQWLREHARQDHRVRQKMRHMMGSDWDDGGTPEQQMLAELDMITLAELVAADDEHGVIRFVGRSGYIDQTPVFGSASSATRILARLWPPETHQHMREIFGGNSDD
jgi:hypothetical protein